MTQRIGYAEVYEYLASNGWTFLGEHGSYHVFSKPGSRWPIQVRAEHGKDGKTVKAVTFRMIKAVIDAEE